MTERGAIKNQDAYALGKMLDHSAWQRGEHILPRGITPSDFDMVFDNDPFGCIIFGELSSQHAEWCDLSKGQRLLYENAIKGTPHLAVLCRHAVRLEDARPIDTRFDVQSFQVLVDDYGFVKTSVVPGEKWERFVLEWYEQPFMVRRKIIAKRGIEIANHDAGNGNGKMQEGTCKTIGPGTG